MKLSAKVSDLLVELIDIESIDHKQLLKGSTDLLCQNLLALYGKTSNQKSHDLILEIIDKGGYSLFGSSHEYLDQSGALTNQIESVKSNSDREFSMSEDEFMDLLPINGYFH